MLFTEDLLFNVTPPPCPYYLSNVFSTLSSFAQTSWSTRQIPKPIGQSSLLAWKGAEGKGRVKEDQGSAFPF